MAAFSFCDLDPTKAENLLSQMFHILHTNMSKIAPTGSGYEADMQMWLSYMRPNLGEKQIILMYAGEKLAGYFQCSVDNGTVLIEEIEILPEYQRTMLFWRFLKYLNAVFPDGIEYAEAYINKHNANSQRIAEKLGMKAVGENASGHSLLYRGKWTVVQKYLA